MGFDKFAEYASAYHLDGVGNRQPEKKRAECRRHEGNHEERPRQGNEKIHEQLGKSFNRLEPNGQSGDGHCQSGREPSQCQPAAVKQQRLLRQADLPQSRQDYIDHGEGRCRACDLENEARDENMQRRNHTMIHKADIGLQRAESMRHQMSHQEQRHIACHDEWPQSNAMLVCGLERRPQNDDPQTKGEGFANYPQKADAFPAISGDDLAHDQRADDPRLFSEEFDGRRNGRALL